MDWLSLDTQNCPVQRTLALVGEKWSLLLIRETINGVRRFDDFRDHLGMSEAVLSDRLRKLLAMASSTPARTARKAVAPATSTYSPTRAGTSGR